LHDYLLRTYDLYRLETAYAIRYFEFIYLIIFNKTKITKQK